MSTGLDPLNMILLAVAAIVLWRLWATLGTRTGFEKPPIVLTPSPQKAEEEAPASPRDGEVLDPLAKEPVWKGHAKEGSPVALGLEAIAARSPGFTASSFLRGANAAYEMVLEAFAAADKAALKPLLSKDLADNFNSAIDTRLAKGDTMKFQFVGVKSATIKEAALNGNKAQVGIQFISEMISATVDKQGTVQEGDDKSIRSVTDVWTFERDVTSRDPNWKLVDTSDNA
jgi:predicted lipid-binding transport protein (Tim44 family)